MALKINPFHQIVWRSPNSLQVGLGQLAFIRNNVSPGEERLIDALYYGVPESSLAALAKQNLVSAEATTAIIDGLRPLLLRPETKPEDRPFRETTDAEAMRASLDNRSSHQRILARRASTSVHIESLDATGLTLLLALAAAGIGTITSGDNSRVETADVTSNVYPAALRGRMRITAAKLILDSSWPGTKLLYTVQHPTVLGKSSLAVLVNHQVTKPAEVGLWGARGIPVIEIRYQPDGAEVSPVLPAGAQFGCLSCRDHHQQDLDGSHLTVSSQLFGSPLRFDDGGTRLVATGLALQEILRFLDTAAANQIGYRYLRAATAGQNSQWDPEATVTERLWASHPACGCQVSANLAQAV